MMTSFDRSSSSTTLSSLNSGRRSNCKPPSGLEEEMRGWRSSSSLFGRTSKATALKNVKNVQQSIMLLGNLVKDKRRFDRPTDEKAKDMDVVSNADSAIDESDGSYNCKDPIVRLVPFIDPILPYRTSSPCRSNFRTLSTITQIRRSVSLNRIRSNSPTSIPCTRRSASSLLSLEDLEDFSDNRSFAATKLTKHAQVSHDRCSSATRHRYPTPTDICAAAHAETPHKTVDPMIPLKPPRSQPQLNPDSTRKLPTKPSLSLHDDSKSNISNLSNLTPRTRRRLFNKRDKSLSESAVSVEQSNKNQGEANDNIEKVCIESWLSDFPTSQQNTAESIASSSTGRNWSFSTRILEDDNLESVSMEYPSIPTQDPDSFCSQAEQFKAVGNTSTPVVTPSSFMDGYLCNCQFDPHEYCVVHNNIKVSDWGAGDETSRPDINRTETDLSSAERNRDRTERERRIYEEKRITEKHLQNTSTFNHYNSLVTIHLDDIGNECQFNDSADQTKNTPRLEAEININLNNSDQFENNSSGILHHNNWIIPSLRITRPSESDDKSAAPDVGRVSQQSIAISVSPQPRCVFSPNTGDIPKVKTPCFEDLDKLSEDSFFTESDSNSLIGNIVLNMLGI